MDGDRLTCREAAQLPAPWPAEVRRPLPRGRLDFLRAHLTPAIGRGLLVLRGASVARYRSCRQNLALVGPFEGFGHAPVEEGDELDQALAQVIERREGRAS